MRPCLTSVGRPDDDRHRRFSDGPHLLRHCVTDFAGNVGCTPELADPRSTTTRRRILAPRRWRAATAGAASTTSISPGSTPTRARRARSGAPTGGSPGRPASTPVSSFAAGREHRGAARPLAAASGRSTRCTSGCATRPATTRRRRRSRCRCASTTCRPGVAFEAGDGAGVPEQIRADGDRRALRAGRRRDLLPAARRRRTGPSCRAKLQPAGDGQSELGRAPAGSRARAPTSSGPTPSTAPATRPRPRGAPMAPRWRCARRRRRWRPKRALPPRAKTRLFARLRGGDGRGDAADDPLRRPRPCSAAASLAPTAPASPAASCGSSPGPSRGALAPSADTLTVADR